MVLMVKVIGCLLILDYILCRMLLNISIRISAWFFYVLALTGLSMSIIGIPRIPAAFRKMIEIEDTFGKSLPLNPLKLSSVQYLIHDFFQSFDVEDSKPSVMAVPAVASAMPEEPSTSMDTLMQRIQTIADNPNL